MSGVFADTAYYLALFNPRDELHAAAVSVTSQISDSIVTTAWVLTEFADALCRQRHRALAARFIADLADDRITIVPPSAELFNRGLELYSTRTDKDWSLTDCISFVVMQQQNISHALTADKHFEQAGFSTLLK
jgi:uncharacterized protein